MRARRRALLCLTAAAALIVAPATGAFAVALPRTERGGQALALNWTLVQGLLMWFWSMNSLGGNTTTALAVLAWFGGWVSTALTAGWPVRLA